jgi:hypothetical protein
VVERAELDDGDVGVSCSQVASAALGVGDRDRAVAGCRVQAHWCAGLPSACGVAGAQAREQAALRVLEVG